MQSFGHLQFILVYLVHFGLLGLIRSTLVHFGPLGFIRSILVHLLKNEKRQVWVESTYSNF